MYDLGELFKGKTHKSTLFSESDIENVVIPVLPYDVQLEISKRVQESFALRKEAKKLIEVAVKAVEFAIEKSENEAMTWLNDTIQSEKI